jgi:phosphoglycolate phosphatase-like HAD superfamily hydrolase
VPHADEPDALGAEPLGLGVAGVVTGGFASEELTAAGFDVVLAEVKDLLGYVTD